MSGILLLLALAAQVNPPTSPQVEQQNSPVPVLDNTPDFRAMLTSPNPHTGVRYRIQVSTSSAVNPTTFAFNTVTHWNSNAAGTDFASIVSFNTFCPEIPYGAVAPAGIQTAPLLDWNTQYFWIMKFWTDGPGPGVNAVERDFFSPPRTFTMGSPSILASANGNGASSGGSWRLVGVPVAANLSVPASQLLDDVGTLYHFNEATRTYVILAPGDNVTGGRGYFTQCDAAVTLDLSAGKVASGLQLLTFTRNELGVPTGQEIVEGKPADAFAGNHFAANPFNAPIDWRSIGSGGNCSRIGVDNTYYKWDGTQYVTYNGGTGAGAAGPFIGPFQGFGIVASVNNGSIIMSEPAPTSGFGTQSAGAGRKSAGTTLRAGGSPDPNRWALGVHAASGSALDTENFAGVALESSDHHDENDGQEPGTLNSTYVLMKFPHWDWPAVAQDYTHDTRRARHDVGDEIVWDFVVSGNTGLPATLTWPAFADLPLSDWQYFLEDPATSTVVDLSAASSFVTSALNGTDIPLVLRAKRLTEFRGSLQISAAGAVSAPSQAAPGQAGVAMLAVDVAAAGEPAVVTSFTVRHEGSGDPDGVLVTLSRAGVALAGPTPFTAGEATWTLSETIDPAEAQTWVVSYDFGAGASGTHGASVEASDAAASGFYTTKSITAAAAVLSSGLTSVAVASSGSSSCGLLGGEVGLLLIGLAALRRMLR